MNKDYSISNGWAGLPSGKALEEYLMWLRKEKISGMEAIDFENFAKGVMDMYYQLTRVKKAMDK